MYNYSMLNIYLCYLNCTYEWTPSNTDLRNILNIRYSKVRRGFTRKEKINDTEIETHRQIFEGVCNCHHGATIDSDILNERMTTTTATTTVKSFILLVVKDEKNKRLLIRSNKAATHVGKS